MKYILGASVNSEICNRGINSGFVWKETPICANILSREAVTRNHVMEYKSFEKI